MELPLAGWVRPRVEIYSYVMADHCATRCNRGERDAAVRLFRGRQ